MNNNILIANLIVIIAFITAFTFHEFSHALVAYLLGDDTAKKMGRISLNPFVHIDIIGLLFLIFFRIGWGKPVIMDPRNFKYPKIYEIIASLAGPFSNFLLALITLYILKYFHFSVLIQSFFSSIVYMNVMLGIFNILPVPPLDGGHIISIFIPKEKMQIFLKLQIVFILLLFFIFMLPTTQQLFVNAINNTINFLKKLVI